MAGNRIPGLIARCSQKRRRRSTPISEERGDARGNEYICLREPMAWCTVFWLVLSMLHMGVYKETLPYYIFSEGLGRRYPVPQCTYYTASGYRPISYLVVQVFTIYVAFCQGGVIPGSRNGGFCEHSTSQMIKSEVRRRCGAEINSTHSEKARHQGNKPLDRVAGRRIVP